VDGFCLNFLVDRLWSSDKSVRIFSIFIQGTGSKVLTLESYAYTTHGIDIPRQWGGSPRGQIFILDFYAHWWISFDAEQQNLAWKPVPSWEGKICRGGRHPELKLTASRRSKLCIPLYVGSFYLNRTARCDTRNHRRTRRSTTTHPGLRFIFCRCRGNAL